VARQPRAPAASRLPGDNLDLLADIRAYQALV
jgi:hypothetical protein